MVIRSLLILTFFVVCLVLGLEERNDEFLEYQAHLRYRRSSNVVRTPEFSEELIDSIVDAHNSARRNVEPRPSNMRKMHWDDTLAEYATELSRSCSLKASPSEQHPRFGLMGVNRFVSTGIPFGASLFDAAFAEWMREENDYDYFKVLDQCNTGFSGCTSYKQIVWARSFLVGCGASVCSNIKIDNKKSTKRRGVTFFCMYTPRGNAFAKDTHLSGRSCSECSDPRDTCENNLCENPRRLEVPSSPGNWLNWGPWSECSRTCGFGGAQNRHRKCSFYVNEDCIGTSTQTKILCADGRSCTRAPTKRPTTAPTRRPREWSSWGSWGKCTTTCGEGTSLRRRRCLPNDGIGVCSGSSVQASSCTVKQTCEPLPEWRKWGTWTRCTTTCDGGERNRRRTCSASTPRNACKGVPSQSQECNTAKCFASVVSVSGWGPWRQWSPCTATCGLTGTRRRSRICLGTNCPGRAVNVWRCNRKTCPIQQTTGWAPWQSWGRCTAPCGGGLRARTRVCRDAPCPGRNIVRWRCNTQAC